MIPREGHLERIDELLSVFPVVGIVGARQVGKTTLARLFLDRQLGPNRRLDLENPRDLAVLADPMLALESLEGIVVLDEIQRRPDIFPVLRVLVDRRPNPAKFLVLGSASPDMLRQTSETLAGRIAYLELPALRLDEVGAELMDRLWLRGGFPSSFLAASDETSFLWRESFLQTFLERDLPNLGVRIEAPALYRFWSMLAHYHGQILSASELGRSLGVAHTTIRRHLDALVAAMVVRELRPWHENLKKRQVKAPKVYVRDSGLLHALLDIRDDERLAVHPKVGASWEGFALEQVVARLGLRSEQCFFWRAHTGAEVDLLVPRGEKRVGYEFKRTSTPKVTRSMRTAVSDLGLARLIVVHPGAESYPMAERIRAVGIADAAAGPEG